MKRFIAVILFAVALMASSFCSAAQLPISDMKVSPFVEHCNTFFKAPDGNPFFPAPTLLPNYSTEQEKMYISQMQVAKEIVMVQYNTYADEKIRSLVIYARNDQAGKAVATQLAVGIAEALGLSNEEMDNIFRANNNDNIFKTYCKATNRNITVMAGWEEMSDAFTVRFLASDD